MLSLELSNLSNQHPSLIYRRSLVLVAFGRCVYDGSGVSMQYFKPRPSMFVAPAGGWVVPLHKIWHDQFSV